MKGAVITTNRHEGKFYVLDSFIAEGYGTRYLCVEFKPETNPVETYGPPVLILPTEITAIITMPLQLAVMSGQIQTQNRVMNLTAPGVGVMQPTESVEAFPESEAFKPKKGEA